MNQPRAKKRTKVKASSQRWLARAHRDPWRRQAQAQGWASRSAFKLMQIDDKFQLLSAASQVLDLGASPGGWCQVAVHRIAGFDPTKASVNTGGSAKKPIIIALDLNPMPMIPKVLSLQADITASDTLDRLSKTLTDQGWDGVSLILSDIAPASSGHSATDYWRWLDLAEQTIGIAQALSRPGGHFVMKLFDGPSTGELCRRIDGLYDQSQRYKPIASHRGSSELYIIAQGYRRAASHATFPVLDSV